jgi:hypothetical protein
LEPDQAADLTKDKFYPRAPRRRNVVADEFNAALDQALRARVPSNEVKVLTRRGYDWTNRFKKIASDVRHFISICGLRLLAISGLGAPAASR